MATLGSLTFNETLPKSERTSPLKDVELQLKRSNALLAQIFDILPTNTYLDIGYTDGHILSEIKNALSEDEYERGVDQGYTNGWDDGYSRGQDNSEE